MHLHFDDFCITITKSKHQTHMDWLPITCVLMEREPRPQNAASTTNAFKCVVLSHVFLTLKELSCAFTLCMHKCMYICY